MHGRVEPGRHVAVFGFEGDIVGMALGAVPFAEVQVFAAAVNVVLP